MVLVRPGRSFCLRWARRPGRRPHRRPRQVRRRVTGGSGDRAGTTMASRDFRSIPRPRSTVLASTPRPLRQATGNGFSATFPRDATTWSSSARTTCVSKASAIRRSTSSTRSFPPTPRGPTRRRETGSSIILPSHNITKTRWCPSSWPAMTSRSGILIQLVPRQANELRRRLRRSGGDGSPRDLAIHQQLRRLGQGQAHRSSRPDPHGQE